MIGSLLAKLNLPQTDTRILSGIVQHLQEIGVGHEMRAGAGRKIPAARQSPHGCRVDVPVAADGVFQRVARLGQRGRIQDNEIKARRPRSPNARR